MLNLKKALKNTFREQTQQFLAGLGLYYVLCEEVCTDGLHSSLLNMSHQGC